MVCAWFRAAHNTQKQKTKKCEKGRAAWLVDFVLCGSS